MNTPISKFTDEYAEKKMIRAHMPGHKGGGENYYSLDITEIDGADSLFEADGIIFDSEKNASAVFGSGFTYYSAGGSTLCIYTMLALLTMKSRCKKVVAARNCHRSFLNACIMLDLEPVWIYPEYESTVVSGNISGSAVEAAICGAGEAACVYITSPDYLGRLYPLDDIAEVCRKYDVPLAVDNAHGAYLRFVYDNGTPAHPLFHGADICCDSAHKTLPVLTGGAYLHISRDYLPMAAADVKEIMSMFGSTSPSYLILRSLDKCNAYMENGASDYFEKMRYATDELKIRLKAAWHIEPSECGKLTVFAPPSGMTGIQLAAQLRERGVECEYADNTHTVMMLTGLSIQQIQQLGNVMENIPQPRIIVPTIEATGFGQLRRAMSIREAAFADDEEIPVDKAEGRICSRAVSCCPPGIAVVVGGEIFSAESINILKNYSILNVNVVK